jgi:uncharacterized OB-fold protein
VSTVDLLDATRLPWPEVSPGPDAGPFWAACRRHRLVLPFCVPCGEYFFYPRPHCPGCGSRDVDWRPVTGRGRLHTFCIQYRSGLPGFADAVPFVTAIVELDEGPRMMSFLTGVPADPAGIACEMPVEVGFLDLDGGVTLPVFHPVVQPGQAR